MDENRIQLDLGLTRRHLEEADRVDLEASFDIPVESRWRGVSITGVVLHLVGLGMFILMAVLLIWSGPAVWFNWTEDLAASQTVKLWVTLLAMMGATFLFAGLALYTYGRTVRGGEDLSREGVTGLD